MSVMRGQVILLILFVREIVSQDCEKIGRESSKVLI